MSSKIRSGATVATVGAMSFVMAAPFKWACSVVWGAF